MNTGDLEDDAVFVFPQAVKSAQGEQMQSDDLSLRNGIGFFGETDYQIVPQKIAAEADGNALKLKVRSHSVTALKIHK